MADLYDRTTYSISNGSRNTMLQLDPPPSTLWPFSSSTLSTEILIVNLEYKSLCCATSSKHEYCYFDVKEINNFFFQHKAASTFKIYFGAQAVDKIDLDDTTWKTFLDPVDEIVVEGELTVPFLKSMMLLLKTPSSFIFRCGRLIQQENMLSRFATLPKLPRLIELHFNFRTTDYSSFIENLVVLRDRYSAPPISLKLLNLSFGKIDVVKNWNDVTDAFQCFTIPGANITILIDTKKPVTWEEQLRKRFNLQLTGICLDGLADNEKRYETFAGVINERFYRFLWKIRDH